MNDFNLTTKFEQRKWEIMIENTQDLDELKKIANTFCKSYFDQSIKIKEEMIKTLFQGEMPPAMPQP